MGVSWCVCVRVCVQEWEPKRREPFCPDQSQLQTDQVQERVRPLPAGVWRGGLCSGEEPLASQDTGVLQYNKHDIFHFFHVSLLSLFILSPLHALTHFPFCLSASFYLFHALCNLLYLSRSHFLYQMFVVFLIFLSRSGSLSTVSHVLCVNSQLPNLSHHFVIFCLWKSYHTLMPMFLVVVINMVRLVVFFSERQKKCWPRLGLFS